MAHTHGIEIVPHLAGFYRFQAPRVTLDGSGDGRLSFAPIRQGFALRVDGVTVGGSGLGGALVELYRGSVADDTYLAAEPLGATVPALVWQPEADVWLQAGEGLQVEVTGATASSDAIASLWGRLYELEERGWPVQDRHEPTRVVVVDVDVPPPGPPAIGEAHPSDDDREEAA